MAIVVIHKYIFPNSVFNICRNVLDFGITPASPVDITLDNATITNPVAAANAISFREISFLPQNAEAFVSFSFTLAPAAASTSSTYGCLKCLRKNPIDGIAINTKKYSTISKLSATVAADIMSPDTSNAAPRAAKFTVPPI